MKRISGFEEVDLGLKLQNQDNNGGPTFNGYPFDTSYRLGEMGRCELGFPFTLSQYKELERQAMIYKYMVSSLPVPPDLLYSSLNSPSSYLFGRYGNGLNYKWVGNSKDAEPGRCRRTDGKKWRCSRDVAPNQKYCERHLHRGRPRSRKPVELVLNGDNSLNKNIISPTKKTKLNEPDTRSVGSLISKASTFDHSMVSGVSPFHDSRSLVCSEEQQWQHLVQTNMNSQVFQHQLEGESMNLNSHVGFNAKSDLSLLERPLIDAWPMITTGNKDNCASNKVSFSSTPGGHFNAFNEDMCQIHMGLRVADSWVDSPASLGGPLAEVLRPGSVATISDAGEGDFVTPPATAVSSPSGVLHKTFASLSDSSGSSSPTCPSSKAKSDVPFHWLN